MGLLSCPGASWTAGPSSSNFSNSSSSSESIMQLMDVILKQCMFACLCANAAWTSHCSCTNMHHRSRVLHNMCSCPACIMHVHVTPRMQQLSLSLSLYIYTYIHTSPGLFLSPPPSLLPSLPPPPSFQISLHDALTTCTPPPPTPLTPDPPPPMASLCEPSA